MARFPVCSRGRIVLRREPKVQTRQQGLSTQKSYFSFRRSSLSVDQSLSFFAKFASLPDFELRTCRHVVFRMTVVLIIHIVAHSHVRLLFNFFWTILTIPPPTDLFIVCTIETTICVRIEYTVHLRSIKSSCAISVPVTADCGLGSDRCTPSILLCNRRRTHSSPANYTKSHLPTMRWNLQLNQ